MIKGEYKTDYENYITDGAGNPLQGAGDMEALLEGIVYYPPSHVIGTMSAGVKFKKKYLPTTLQGELMETGGNL